MNSAGDRQFCADPEPFPVLFNDLCMQADFCFTEYRTEKFDLQLSRHEKVAWEPVRE